MELIVTSSFLAAGVVVVAAMSWLERRPRRGLDPLLVPTTLVMWIGIVVIILALVHLLTLWGVELPQRGM